MVFVPGPHDPGLGDLLPAVRLPEWCTEELQRTVPSAVFTTNPCR
jgi:DNA polymerase epsilon subunit 2